MEHGVKREKSSSKVMPAGAAQLDKVARNTIGALEGDFLQATVDGEQWAAGIEPGRLQVWELELYQDYKSTQFYKAFFYAALFDGEAYDPFEMLLKSTNCEHPLGETSNNVDQHCAATFVCSTSLHRPLCVRSTAVQTFDPIHNPFRKS